MSEHLYLVFGEDEYQVSAKTAQIMDGLAPIDDVMAREIIDADAANGDEVTSAVGKCLEALQTSGLFSAEKTVWLKGATFLGTAQVAKSEAAKTAVGRLADLIKAGLPPGQSLVISATGVDKRSAFFKACKAAGELHEFARAAKARMAEADAEQFAADRFKMAGLKASRDVVRAFLDRVGLDSRQIASEVEKLAAYTGERNTVAPADVEAITSSSREAVGWDLADAVGARDLPRALRVLRQLLFERQPAFMLIRGIENRIAQLQLLREAINKRWLRSQGSGRGKQAVWTDLPPEVDAILTEDVGRDPRKEHPYRLLLLAEQASKFTGKELERCRQALVQAHAELVSSRTPDDVVMELLLVRMLGRSA
ncbi:MAG: DNA polymerase III subunit delta [Kiritimatiellae bacterium]|nr:DNA polymerase III subunit delta [Kiritimatiellia bacterium]